MCRLLKKGTKMRRILSVLILLILCPVYAGSEDDIIRYNQQQMEEAMRNLANGSSDTKYLAALYMGGSRNPRFVRPLGRELLAGLKDPRGPRDPASRDIQVACGPELKDVCPPTATQDPFIKSSIAWAMGQIGHKAAVPFLKEAMVLVVARLEQDLKQTQARRASLRNGEYVNEIVMDRNVAGPAQLRPGYVYPFNPDVHWSESDEFKTIPSPDFENEGHRIRMNGHNYVNVAANILQALGQIKDPSALETIQAYLEHPIKSVRSAAILAAGRQGKAALPLLLSTIEKEKDNAMKARFARSILFVDKAQAATFKTLVELLKDRERGVRIEAIFAFRELAMAESADELREALRVEEDDSLRNLLKEAIGNAELDAVMPVNY